MHFSKYSSVCDHPCTFFCLFSAGQLGINTVIFLENSQDCVSKEKKGALAELDCLVAVSCSQPLDTIFVTVPYNS